MDKKENPILINGTSTGILKAPEIISFCSWKGGTGKTTLQAASIHLLAEMGYKIGIIDLDSNCSMTKCFDFQDQNFTSFEFLTGVKGTFSKMTENIDILPSKKSNKELTNLGENTLKKYLRNIDISKYDFIFIDTTGTMSALTRNAMKASDKIIVPALVAPRDFDAVSDIFDEIDMMDLEAEITVVINNVDTTKADPEIIKQYDEEYEDYLYSAKITNMKSMKNMTKNVFEYKLTGQAKNNIIRFVKEVIL